MNALCKKVLVIGTGKSGIAAAGLLLANDAEAVLFDENTETDQGAKIEAAKTKAAEIAKAAGNGEVSDRISMVCGREALTQAFLSDITLSVFSPGVPTDLELANVIREAGIPIWGEIELAWAVEKGRVLAITGTNGKTTTTSLLGEIMKRHAEKVFVVGNIGIPYTEEVAKTSDDSWTVAEISSFQLETTHGFHPVASAILNLTPDHLNRHHTMENYVHAKQDITKAQTKDDVCVLNAEDPYTEEFIARCPARVVLFSSGKELADGYFYKDGTIYFVKNGEKEPLIRMEETNLLGVHNAENIMAAFAMAEAAGVARETILAGIKDFHAVAHRIEYVKTVDGVWYYNDSKGTNPDAAIKAIGAMQRPTWLIGGGYDKDSTYDEWIESFDGKVQGLVLLGQTAEKIAACARAHGFDRIYMTNSLEEAVSVCRSHAKEGDAVLLSPACASWGMFDNYEQRGDLFKKLVREF
ncbi:MAG: UDP-N-acetylmuramoyl-L-alanine--D-glutamate ligase [Lachnospiraceae bacterium]|nr:UDP-N-acetylmuramoyl-L-alanine--D-glutamate ligase [Lachnospiraceae bacterium]